MADRKDPERQGIRDAVPEFGSPSPIGNGPHEGPLVKTDPVMSPAAQVAAAGAMKAYGEVSSHPGAPVVKAAGHAWAGAASAEPGASRWLTAGFDVAGDALKDQAGVHNCELTVDTTLSPAGETITSAAGRKWPARPDDEQGRLIH